MNNPRITEYGVRSQFSSTNQPANRGRKPSKLKKWIKEQNVSNEDFIAIFKTIIASHTLEELEKMVSEENKKKLPVIVALCISAFLHDMRTGTLTAANSVLDRIMGKPTQMIIEAVAPIETQDVLKRLSDSELLDVMELQKNEKSKQPRKR